MEIILNRWRGTGVIFTSIHYIKGVHFYAIYIGLLFGFLSTYYYGLLAVILFLIGESFAWGKWDGSLCHPENITDEVKNNKCGKSFPYIHYMANYIQNQDENYKYYCQIALAIRGFIWWTPLMILLGYLDLLNWLVVILNSFVLAIGFPIACELSHYWNFEYKAKYLSILTNGEKQEVIYGLIQFVCLSLSIFLTFYFKG